MGFLSSLWTKATGNLKDMVSLTFASLNIYHDKVDVAVVKATNHNKSPPKEKHVLTAIKATNALRHKNHLAYVLSKRLKKTETWNVLLKTLILVHRLITEGHHSFSQALHDEFNRKDVVQWTVYFMDRSNPKAYECSMWLRNYFLYLVEKKDFKMALNNIVLNYGLPFPHARALQVLLDRLLDCTPKKTGLVDNVLIQYALTLLVKDSLMILKDFEEVMSKMSKFYSELSEEQVARVVYRYEKALDQVERLQKFYDVLKEVPQIEVPFIKKPTNPFSGKD